MRNKMTILCMAQIMLGATALATSFDLDWIEKQILTADVPGRAILHIREGHGLSIENYWLAERFRDGFGGKFASTLEALKDSPENESGLFDGGPLWHFWRGQVVIRTNMDLTMANEPFRYWETPARLGIGLNVTEIQRITLASKVALNKDDVMLMSVAPDKVELLWKRKKIRWRFELSEPDEKGRPTRIKGYFTPAGDQERIVKDARVLEWRDEIGPELASDRFKAAWERSQIKIAKHKGKSFVWRGADWEWTDPRWTEAHRQDILRIYRAIAVFLAIAMMILFGRVIARERAFKKSGQ